MKPRQISGVRLVVFGNETSTLSARVRTTLSADEILAFCRTEDSVAPALAIYDPSKHVPFCREFVQGQQWEWQRAVRAATRIFVIGLRVHPIDRHIWDPLEKAFGAIFYIGRDPGSFDTWASKVGRRNAMVLSDSFLDALPKIAERLS